ncbi:NERD domain-containing protein [Halobacillus salinarum]|uniref:NERD domain-containing protein n=1 Tax=Halobacillus salinarum TaxID=2932257 RepID=A0ABY4EM84_9BACI|nr:nuclease-related domain-containing protein [Halobacillus salinarum]UOQ45563.1 NERD domain-containing protein [Halobacillus salinarum]
MAERCDVMIIKDRQFPLEIQQLQVLKRRLRPDHPKMQEVEAKLVRQLAGYKGELSLGYPLSFLPADYFIFHDLRLKIDGHFFQMDTLILSPKWLMIIEVKNIAGEIHFDQRFNQLVRKVNDDQEAFSNPIVQVERHRSHLNCWMKNFSLPELPIHCLVASSHPHSIISSNDPHLNKVVRTDNLPEKLKEFDSAPNTLNKKDMNKISTLILKNHTAKPLSTIDQLKLSPKDIKAGVYCEKCSYLPLIRKHARWVCPSCSKNSKHAHLASLKDYALLFGPEITNASMRRFLRLESSHTAKRLLSSLEVEKSGVTKGRKYRLRYDN